MAHFSFILYLILEDCDFRNPVAVEHIFITGRKNLVFPLRLITHMLLVTYRCF